MESFNTSLPSPSSRKKFFKRSLSVQPETPAEVSPHPCRRKSKNPGRSLTEIFTSKPKLRATSSDTSVSLRRRTMTAMPYFQTSPIEENVESTFMNRSFSELPYSFRVSDHSNCEFLDSRSSKNKEIENVQMRKAVVPNSDISPVRQKEESKLPYTDKAKCTEEIGKNNVKSSLFWNILKTGFKMFFLFIALLLIMLLLLVGFSTYFAYKKSQCDLKREMKIPIEELKQQLSLSVIGQEVAVNLILNSLKEFEVNRIGSPLILWMVGWTGSGKTYTTNIVKKVFSPISEVLTVIPSLFPQNNDELQKEIFGLYQLLDPCSYNLIVIDGWDENNLALQILEYFIFNLQNITHKKNGKGKTILVLCGTQGSQYINREYLKLFRGGKRRKDFEINDFENVTKMLTQVKKLNGITKSFIFVPFMPMEGEQVRMCIIEELSRLKESRNLIRDFDQENIISEVIKQLNFVPLSHPLLADTGCKRVQPLLHRILLFEDVENTL